MLVTQTLVEQALQRSLELDEYESLEFLSLEAEALISGYVGKDYGDTSTPAPQVVLVVAARMVARALKVNPETEDLASRQTTTGPYSQTTTFLPEGRGGNAVYISKMDKLMLRKVKPSITSVQLVSGRSAQ